MLKGGNIPNPLKDLIAMKKHMKAEQAEKEKYGSTDTVKNSNDAPGRGFAKPFTGTIPFELTWNAPNITTSKISGPLASYQPFIPALNYNLDELISKPSEPDVLKTMKESNSLGN